MRVSPRLRALGVLCLPMLGLATFGFCLTLYLEAGRHLTPASVSVSGYYRRDGTYVRPYHRRPPGSVAHDAPYESKRSLCELGMFLGVAISLVPVFPFLIKKQRQNATAHWVHASPPPPD